MSQFFAIHPTHPQGRLVSRAAAILRSGAVVAYPTDSTYAFGWRVGEKSALDRVRRIRGRGEDHYPTLVCRDLSELAIYARVDNTAFRLLRAHTPGPYTFVLRATREVPRRFLDPRRKTVGLRVPDHPIVNALLDQLGEPMMSSTLMLPGDDLPMTDAAAIRDRLGKQCDLIIDGGAGSTEFTTVVDLSDEIPRVIRHGLGDAAAFADGPVR